MFNKSIEELKRRCEADPKNEALRRQFIIELVRQERFDQISVPIIEHSYSPPTEESLTTPIVVPHTQGQSFIVTMLDHILQRAAELSPAIVFVDGVFGDTQDVTWAAHRSLAEGYETVDILRHDGGYLRPILAHFCARSLMSSTYGGYTGQTLLVDNQEYTLWIHISNDRRTGLWARVGIYPVEH